MKRLIYVLSLCLLILVFGFCFQLVIKHDANFVFSALQTNISSQSTNNGDEQVPDSINDSKPDGVDNSSINQNSSSGSQSKFPEPNISQPTRPTPPPPPSSETSSTSTVTFPININTATKEELMALPEIDEEKARVI